MDQTEQLKEHAVTLTARNEGNVTGVDKVLSVRSEQICLQTVMGELTITGKNLSVRGYTERDKTFRFNGDVDGVTYSKAHEPLLKKLFK